MKTGASSAPMSVPDWRMYMVPNSRRFIKNMKPRVAKSVKSSRANYGLKYWIVKWKQAHLICATKMPQIRKVTRKILARLRALICVLKLLNTLTKMKLRFVILQALRLINLFAIILIHQN